MSVEVLMNFAIVCNSCGITKFVDYQLPPEHQYVCGQCGPKGGCEPDPLLNRVRSTKHLGVGIEGFGWDEQRGREWIRNDFQIAKPRRPRKVIPEWVENASLFNQVLKSHPQYRVLGETWWKIVYWHYQMQWSSSEIAEELDLSVDSVKGTLKRLNRRARRFVAKNTARAREIGSATALYSQGFSVRDVSKALSVSVGKAWQLRVHFKRPCPDPICEAELSDDFIQAQLSPPTESNLLNSNV